MATEVLLPKIGFSMNEGVLAEWLVADGGNAVEGEPLYALESEKSTQVGKLIAHSEFAVVPGSGHYPWAENTAYFTPLLLDFLRRHVP